MGLTMSKFASFWKTEGVKFDLVFCLGDRYEMLAAVFAGVPFQIPFAHLHGGEKTLGAIDNIFRHSLTHASKIHFASTESHRKRTEQLLDVPDNTYNIGALSLDNIKDLTLLNVDEFKEKWNVDFNQPTALVTFHPETVNADKNEEYVNTLVEVMKSKKDLHFLVTMPNADTAGSIIRNIFIDKLEDEKNVTMVENLGVQSYFSAMNHSSFLMGNTSSGIIEAASFKKYVINLGNRQEGRSAGENVIQVPIVEKEIQVEIDRISKTSLFAGDNIYYKGGAANKIIKVLKSIKQ